MEGFSVQPRLFGEQLAVLPILKLPSAGGTSSPIRPRLLFTVEHTVADRPGFGNLVGFGFQPSCRSAFLAL